MRKKDLITEPNFHKPHVVLLGAGASLAALPNGDINNKKLPLMNNLVEVVGLKQMLEKNNINSSGNFETIYSDLKSQDNKITKQIEDIVFQYFDSLYLPETVTIYDKLLLSLRKKDAIFTFNWDPFLFDSYQRNKNVAPLPEIYFLHGNVRIGACKTCDNWGRKAEQCPNCNKVFANVPLIYPVKKKDYFNANKYTAMSWKAANHWLTNAFTISIFGYSAPTSDIEAAKLLKKGWFQESTRTFEHIEVIDILCATLLTERWKPFTPTNHFMLTSSFKDSCLWNWPRRSCEALFYPTTKGIPCERFPILETDNLKELQNAIKEISCYESNT